MPDRLVQHLRDGRQAVGGARRVAEDVMALGVVHRLEVHADHDRRVQRLGALGGGGDDHLARARRQVLGGRGARAVAPGRLDHHVDAELPPRQLGDLRLGQRAHAPSADHDLPAGGLDRPREGAVDGVVAQQVRERGRIGEIVDRDDLQLRAQYISEARASLVGDAKHAASDAAETVDGDSSGHLALSCCSCLCSSRLGLGTSTSGNTQARHDRRPRHGCSASCRGGDNY